MKNQTVAFGVTSLILLGLVAIASAGEPASQPTSTDWPQWRGPNRDGVSPNSPKLLDKWPADGPTLAWSYPVFHSTPMDGGMGSPVVGEGKVVTFFNFHRRVPLDSDGVQVITDEVLKKWMWLPDLPADLAKKFEDAWQSKQLHPSRGAKGAAEGKAFAATLDPKDAEKYGAYLEERFKGGPGCEFSWAELTYLASHKNDKFKMVDDFNAMAYKGVEMHHRGGAPEAFEAALKEVFKDSWLDATICLDAATGKVIWKKEMPGASPKFYGDFCAAATPAISGGKCYVMTTTGLFCYSLADGSVVWQAKAGFANSGPMVLNGAVYLVVPGGPAAFNAETGQLLWKQPKTDASGNNSLMPWASGGKNYIICASGGSGGNLFCLNASSGEIVWKAPEEGRGSLGGDGVYTTPVIVDDNVYVYWGKLRQFKITPQAAEPAGKWELGGGDRDGSPIVYQGYAHVVQHGFRKCLDAKTGEVKWAKPNDPLQNSLSSPILADGKIIATQVGGHEGGGSVVLYLASPDKYQQAGLFNPHVVECSSPAISAGKLYLRCEDSIRCYDLTK